MHFEWDEAKRNANLRKHGVDFPLAMSVFLDPFRLERPDTRKHYGETRIQIIGEAQSEILFVVATPRQGGFRLISARRASREERAAYHASRAHP